MPNSGNSGARRLIGLAFCYHRLTAPIRALKPDAHMGLYDPKREEEIFARVATYNEGPLYNENLTEIYRGILKVMKEVPSRD